MLPLAQYINHFARDAGYPDTACVITRSRLGDEVEIFLTTDTEVRKVKPWHRTTFTSDDLHDRFETVKANVRSSLIFMHGGPTPEFVEWYTATDEHSEYLDSLVTQSILRADLETNRAIIETLYETLVLPES